MTIKGISSMATKAILAELARSYQAQSGDSVAIESVGGVDAALRVEAGEAFDVVVLASDAIDTLFGAGYFVVDSKVELARSGVVVAVRAGAARPEIGSEGALRRAVLAARTIGYSTGPSGAAVAKLFERWRVTARLSDRIVVPPPGVPVGSLVASGEVVLGFQQRSELMHLEGVDVVGPLPPEIEIVTTFSGAVGAQARQPKAARALLDYMASPAAAETKRRHGMEPA